jgi:hypothetical protein
MAAVMDISDSKDSVLSVIDLVAWSPLLRLDNWWRTALNWCRAYGWVCISATLLLLTYLAFSLSNKTPEGRKVVLIEFVFIVIGIIVEKLIKMLKDLISPEYIE